MDEKIYQKAYNIIKSLYGENASFRDGQYEAIEATMTKKRTLVVQKTGWGKSLVYFSCTKMLREQNKGVTFVVSPLLVLMQNQLEAAERLGLKCDVLNSDTRDRREQILQELKNDEIDLVLVTPETLFTDEVQKALGEIKIGLLVIDECHCISDWGHDFRQEYGKLREVIAFLPPNVPILATTATANNRVIKDLEKQLGSDVFVSRGPLTRESLSIQVLNMPSRVERYAWILENISKLKGSGIIYCLTQRDCDYLADFLNKNGISAMPYYSSEARNEENKLAEEKFQRNEIKAIVATIKLGMGYDKGDISFVIHYQMPSNIVSYYQQIGRAGRNIERAYTFLMYGREDMNIINYFIDTAFPTKDETDKIIDFIGDNDGVKLFQIEHALNMRSNRLKKALGFLLNDGFIRKEKTSYYLTPKMYFYDEEKYNSITEIRRMEASQMIKLSSTKECYSKFIVNSLDDFTAKECGSCSNCLGRELLPESVSLKAKEIASEYIDRLSMVIEPRKRFVFSDVTTNSLIKYINKEGICLSKYGEVGYGELVKRDKNGQSQLFCRELVGKSAELLRDLVREQGITHITCVPSLRSDIVKSFAKELATSLKIEFVELLDKLPSRPQNEMENSSYQCANAFKAFVAKENISYPEKVILVDDIVNSRWTLTVCGYKIMEQGTREVYPFVLADNSYGEV